MLDATLKSIHQDNRRSWNAATVAHNSHKGNQIRFFQDGGSTLFPEERQLLGDIAGQDVLHLQCNCGQDSLSLAQLGAHVTGVDICDQAIDFAHGLSTRTGIPTDFHRADLYDWLTDAATAGQRFDVVFSSYGATSWLSDLKLWAQLLSKVLTRGGKFVSVDFHPVLYMFDEHGQLKYPYSSAGSPCQDERGVSDYVGESGPALVPWGFQEGIRNFQNPFPNHFFHWGVGEVLSSLLAAGMRLAVFQEYPYANGCRFFRDAEEAPERRVLPPPHLPSLPMMYGLCMVRS
ncbi:MAG: class I SAM-dependent methyltransferase [Planctomycetota bacterium]|jgi:SAM-dependent methyltransferase